MNRGALVCTEGVNRRLQIFVTIFNSQRSQTNTVLIRQPATTPRLPQHPAGAEPRCSADGDRGRADKAGLRAAAGSDRHGHPRVGAARARPGVSPQPRSLRPDEGSVSVFIISAPPPPLEVGAGGGKEDAVALEECAKWGGKKAAWEGAHRIPTAPCYYVSIFFFLQILFYLNTLVSPEKSLLRNSARSAPRFAPSNG